jgi:GTPase SAR1 family protein
MIGNKIDLDDERVVSTESAEDTMTNLGMTDYFETSAKVNQGSTNKRQKKVEEVFEAIC